jgi:hypothetical protein
MLLFVEDPSRPIMVARVRGNGQQFWGVEDLNAGYGSDPRNHLVFQVGAN